MSAADFLMYSLGIAVWFLMLLTVFLAIWLVRMMKSITETSKTLMITALEFQLAKETLKRGVFSFLSDAINFVKKGGCPL